MQTISVINSGRKVFFHFVCCLGVVALGIFMVQKGRSPVAAWSAIVFFGIGGLVFFLQLMGVYPRHTAERKCCKVIFDSEGFAIIRPNPRGVQSRSMAWSEVCSATAFKRDLGIVDCVCLFLARKDGTGIEADEEMEGWCDFCGALTMYLPGCQSWGKWYLEVAFPAFVTNATEVYIRNSEVKP